MTDQEKLWKVCTDFVEKHKVICAEATAEDRVYENAPELVESICEIVGYAKYDDE